MFSELPCDQAWLASADTRKDDETADPGSHGSCLPAYECTGVVVQRQAVSVTRDTDSDKETAR